MRELTTGLASASRPGKVIWITGLSGSGKTTIARMLKSALEARGHFVVLLDGDELRAFMPLGDRFDGDSRLKLALAYGGLCRLMAVQGAIVICATISMREEVYAWNRANIENYLEVFLDVSSELRAARDPKKYYARIAGGELGDFSGCDQAVDIPSAPDLHLKPSCEEGPAATASKILECLDATSNSGGCLTQRDA
ncbi:MAG: adenylyl-sulfate kinase [Alphaproteobacteria bacterium]|nr:adenylyl-sulfate kinase [Alphaproteobacteria bacterium]